MARPTAIRRLSVVLRPPEALVRLLVEGIGSLDPPAPRGRFVAPESARAVIHHVGDVPTARLDEVLESVRRSAAGLPCFELELLGVFTLPEGGPARKIGALLGSNPTLIELKSRLVKRLAREGRRRPATDFRPAIDLLRFDGPAPGYELKHGLRGPRVVVRELLVQRSVAREGGFAAITVESVPLADA